MSKIPAIDTHAHLWSDDYLDILKSNGSDETEIAKGMGAGITPDDEVKEKILRSNAERLYGISKK